MTDKQILSLALKHGAMAQPGFIGVSMSPSDLRELLQAVADASYERAAKEAYRHTSKQDGCWPDTDNEIRKLKGTLPEMEQGR